MRYAPFHILIKDLSFMIFYFIIMKYNITNETYLPQTINCMPGASTVRFIEIICASLFYNIIPLIISSFTYFPIVYLLRNMFKTKSVLSLIITGTILTLTTPFLYVIMNGWKHNDYYQKTAEMIAWLLCFFVSICTYYFLNRKNMQWFILE
jgi:hypothetical protein